ncbi:3-oxoacyl-ACP synthase [Gramella sp. GC03-9]|uniref:3-oxoacyl-ACP synthase n=1 Tax=Christiangramia oceanisediminis TaxID=2920386 RepID=A0A9X2RBI4_9FLAO|nr:3-oxoacyl-ACP synthase [Gramella oceanisediminis]MCP9200470.1 3-oxoacyl-ACP synthase [Gramella oceanisediminis]
MNKKYYIKDYVILRQGRLIRNGEVLLEAGNPELKDFLRKIYKSFGMRYPKFFKMDDLSRLGFLAAEILFDQEKPEADTALIFANSSSCLETDKAYSKTMSGFPSPSLFVYTLPNIVLGEISIRHGLRSENLFLVQDRFEPTTMIDYSHSLLNKAKASNVLCGWVDLHNTDYDVFLWQIAASGRLEHNEEELNKIYLPE